MYIIEPWPYYYPPYSTYPGVCPGCGRCNCCGRGDSWKPLPGTPYTYKVTCSNTAVEPNEDSK